MRILPPTIDLSIANFTTDDLFGRKDLAAGLTNVISVSEDPLVIALDGEWGTGKSTFLAMWADQLSYQGFPVVRFDAFENDYVADPFLAIAGEIIALVERLKPRAKKKRAEFLSKAKGASRILLRSGLTATTKIITLGVLDGTKISDDIAEVLVDAAGGAAENYLEETLGDSQKQKETLSAFRSALSELPALLTKGNGRKPLVFVIDELDRCRPNFALQTLERIKHFFNVPNVHFVLGVNLDQIENSVKATYGDRVDARLYLQKFITLRHRLADLTQKGDERASEIYIDRQIDRMNFEADVKQEVMICADVIKSYSSRNSLNLRSIDRILTQLSLSYAFGGKSTLKPPEIVSVLCILKIMQPSIYSDIRTGGMVYAAISADFGFSNNAINARKTVEAWWAVCCGGSYDGRAEGVVTAGLPADFPVRDVARYVANNVVDRLHASYDW